MLVSLLVLCPHDSVITCFNVCGVSSGIGNLFPFKTNSMIAVVVVNPRTQQVSFKKALYVAMYRKALKDTSINYQTPFAVNDPEEFCKVLKEKDGYDGKWCLVIDEIGEIEKSFFSLFQEFAVSPQKGHISQESRYQVLLTIIGAIAHYVSCCLC